MAVSYFRSWQCLVAASEPQILPMYLLIVIIIIITIIIICCCHRRHSAIIQEHRCVSYDLSAKLKSTGPCANSQTGVVSPTANETPAKSAYAPVGNHDISPEPQSPTLFNTSTRPLAQVIHSASPSPVFRLFPLYYTSLPEHKIQCLPCLP